MLWCEGHSLLPACHFMLFLTFAGFLLPVCFALNRPVVAQGGSEPLGSGHPLALSLNLFGSWDSRLFVVFCLFVWLCFCFILFFCQPNEITGTTRATSGPAGTTYFFSLPLSSPFL